MFNPTEEQVKAAVDWWIAALKRKAAISSGAGDPTGDIIHIIAAKDARKELEDGRLNDFGFILPKLLRSPCIHNELRQIICTDYNPTGVLALAADLANIDDVLFPIKTIMWIFEDGSVEVANGYGAPAVRIFPKGEENA